MLKHFLFLSVNIMINMVNGGQIKKRNSKPTMMKKKKKQKRERERYIKKKEKHVVKKSINR